MTELQITFLEKLKKSVVRLWINDEPAFRLTLSELEECGLKTGDVLDAEHLAHLHTRILIPKARNRCLDLLAAGDKTRSMLAKKLRSEDFPEDVVEDALSYAKSFHYLDDLRFAVNYIERNRDGKSRMEMTQKLRLSGVDEEQIAEAFSEAELPDPMEQIRMHARRRHFDPSDADDRERDRFLRFLMRKGYSYGDIRHALEGMIYEKTGVE